MNGFSGADGGGLLGSGARSCKTYDEFIGRMAQVPESTLQYFGVAVCGAKKKVNKLTGSGEPKKYLKITLDK